MPKSRVSATQRKASRSSDVKSKGELWRYLGLSLSGGKADKTCLAVLEYYPDQKRIFLAGLFEKIKSEEMISADKKIVDMVTELAGNTRFLAFDAPMTLPRCLSCRKDCGGYEVCPDPEIKWMRKISHEIVKQKPRKMFTPYTQRAVDLYLAELEDENLEIQHALGANLAPLTARAIFLHQRLKIKCIEAAPKVAVWRLGQELKVARAHLLSYRNSVGGEEARRVFLHALVEKAGLFLYRQDQKALCENVHAFDALISAWVAFLKDNSKTESPPTDFPKSAAWVEIPKRKVF